MGGLTLVVASAAGRASSGRPPWAWSRPGLPASVLFSTARDGPCAARSVRVRRRAAMTRSDGVDGRPMRNAAEHPLASLRRDEWKGGVKDRHVLRAFDDTRDLKSSRRRRNPALNGVSPTHNTYPWNYPRYVYEFNLQKRERDGWAGVGMGKGGGRERGGLAG